MKSRGGACNQADAAGFIKLTALRLRIAANAKSARSLAADGSRKSVGVTLPTGGKPLTFDTSAPKRMDLVEGPRRARLPLRLS